MEELSDFDPGRFRLTPEMREKLTVFPTAPPRPRAGLTFIRGPVPFGWLAGASPFG